MRTGCLPGKACMRCSKDLIFLLFSARPPAPFLGKAFVYRHTGFCLLEYQDSGLSHIAMVCSWVTDGYSTPRRWIKVQMTKWLCPWETWGFSVILNWFCDTLICFFHLSLDIFIEKKLRKSLSFFATSTPFLLASPPCPRLYFENLFIDKLGYIK